MTIPHDTLFLNACVSASLLAYEINGLSAVLGGFFGLERDIYG